MNASVKNIVEPLLFFAVLLILWEILVEVIKVPSFILPPPRDLWTAFFKKLPILGHHSIITFIEAFGGFVFGWVPYWFGGLATIRRFQYNDRANKGLTPASFGLAFEDVSFQTPDGVPLKGWWISAPEPKGTVVLIHGLNRSRLEMVKKTPFVHQQDWNALLFDLRHHGASGGSVSSFGWFEKQDAEAAKA